ncbi:UDP-N-acetylglucosamine 2-epimerase (non-hydrolysing) [Nitrosomonas marina]|uniref:UDP-N-acetylglucosamine 2-epimerase (Non-hydrolysing) n=2 Tax=Nitrosomonas marina TaxID=917 RepID=A0A1H8EDH5_9PROT|nr:UDP-N-acetylglucosamine 2-epimerase (non-hydrolysing) [Nitrosomonas marina]
MKSTKIVTPLFFFNAASNVIGTAFHSYKFMPKVIYLVAGARPNFMKIAPIVRALNAHPTLTYKIIHTGQHYDPEMNAVFFEELGIPQPDFFMGVGGGSHAQQTARIMVAFEEYCQKTIPDAVLVVGDVNSTLACSIVAKKLQIPVAHVEAGLRSGDMGMPEEINRLVTDSISDWFFVTEPSGMHHLQHEGKSDDAIFNVGHVMVDNLLYQADKLSRMDTRNLATTAYKKAQAAAGKRYGVVTLHRPSNVDDADTFTKISHALKTIAQELPLIFPVHPRTRQNLEKFAIDLGADITLTGPQSYMSFLHLWKDAAVVLTDSGGLQEETTALGVPCITIRENTERPITVDEGSNKLAGTDPATIIHETLDVLRSPQAVCRRPELWDGKAAERIVAILARVLENLSDHGEKTTPKRIQPAKS